MTEMFNLDAEQAVLGTILLDPKNAHVVQTLVPTDFSISEHVQIFTAISAAAAEGQWLSPITLAPKIENLYFGPQTARQYLARMVICHVDPAHLPEYVLSLKELAARRLIAGLAQNMLAFADAPLAPIGSFVGDIVGELDGISASLRSQKMSMAHISELARETIVQLETGEQTRAISTGLPSLDRITGGWHRGELSIIAGRPSMGKSAFALSALRLAGLRGATSLFFSLEMGAEACSMRMLSDAAWNSQHPIPYNRIDQRKLDAYEIERLRRAEEGLRKLPFHVDTQRGLSVSEIGARARRKQDELARDGKRLDLICIDHLGKLKASDRYAGNRVHETGEKSNALANLAGEIDVGVILLAQLNRGVEGRDDKRPGMSDMRDSGNLEEDADFVGFLYRPAYYLERTKMDDEQKDAQRLSMLEAKRNTLEFIISKNRRGPICTQEFFASIENNAVRDR